ncbi:MAG: hypothetical protein WB813_11550 [Candidatus Acidiferrales bacterium]
MRVKFINGPKAGEIGHLERHVADGLVAAGLAEIVPEEKPAPVSFEPEWEIVYSGGAVAQKIVTIILRVCGRVYRYTGHPQLVNAVRSWDGGQRYVNFGRECPEAIVREYSRIWNEFPEYRSPSSMQAAIGMSRVEDAFRNRVYEAHGSTGRLLSNEDLTAELASRRKK